MTSCFNRMLLLPWVVLSTWSYRRSSSMCAICGVGGRRRIPNPWSQRRQQHPWVFQSPFAHCTRCRGCLCSIPWVQICNGPQCQNRFSSRCHRSCLLGGSERAFSMACRYGRLCISWSDLPMVMTRHRSLDQLSRWVLLSCRNQCHLG